jgi:NTE family protein
VSKIGLVLGGGGITGASYHLAALLALEMATGWEPARADVVVGTSAGAFAAAIVRSGDLSLDSIVKPGEGYEDVTRRIRSWIYRRKRLNGVGRWIRHGVLPSFRNPGLTSLLGAPGRYDPSGIGDWVAAQAPAIADSWPERPTVIVAYDLEEHRRMAFGTVNAPDVALRDAVAASSAVPVVFDPHIIKGKAYVDGGVVSGTNADLVLGNPTPLDLLLVIAPMAAEEERGGAHFYESVFDRVGRSALHDELVAVGTAWPSTDTLVLRPTPSVLAAMRPNPMDPGAAVPTFVRTLASLRAKLARPEVWQILERYLVR